MISAVTGRSRLLLAPLLVLALLLPGAAASGQAAPAPAPSDDTEIVGGQPADPGEYPFQVALLQRGISNRYQAQFCGGSLISPDTVLTAAHCLVDIRAAARSTCSSGTHTLAARRGRRPPPGPPHPHPPRLQPDTYANDVGIIQLGVDRAEAVIPTVQAGQADLWDPGTIATVTGWGNRVGQRLQLPARPPRGRGPDPDRRRLHARPTGFDLHRRPR